MDLITASSSGGDVDNCPIHNMAGGEIFLGWFLTGGIVVSNSAQWIAIVRVGSSHTLSFWNLFVACCNAGFIVVNSFVLTFYKRFVCCRSTWSRTDCINETLGFTQFCVSFVWHYPVYVLYLAYIKEHTAQTIRMSKIMFVVLNLIYVTLTGLAFALVLYYGVDDPVSEWTARVCGGMALVGTAFVWLPQVYRTYSFKTAGALSIPMLIMQSPGSAAVAYFQAFPQKTSPTTWLPALSVALQQFVLLIMCIYYKIKELRLAKDKREHPEKYEDSGEYGSVNGSSGALGSQKGPLASSFVAIIHSPSGRERQLQRVSSDEDFDSQPPEVAKAGRINATSPLLPQQGQGSQGRR